MRSDRRRAWAVSGLGSTAIVVAAGVFVACSSQGNEGPAVGQDASADSTGSSMNDAASTETGPSTEASVDAAIDAPPDGGAGDDAGDGASTGDGGCAPGLFGEPLDLRCSGLYSDFAARTVSADVVQYDPGLHL